MSTEIASATVPLVADPNRIVTISLKACEAEMIRNIAACLARPLDESRTALLRVCNERTVVDVIRQAVAVVIAERIK